MQRCAVSGDKDSENCLGTTSFLKFDSQCGVCGRSDGGPLLECGYCPKVFHLNCLPLKSFEVSPSLRRICPYHRCIICGSTQNLCRCVLCINSFCPSHIPRVVEYIDKSMKGVDKNDPNRCIFIFCPCKFSRHIAYLTFKLKEQERDYTWERQIVSNKNQHFSTESVKIQNDVQSPLSGSKSVQEEEQLHNHSIRLLANALPLCPNPDITKPDPTLVAYVRQFINETNLLQKELAEELHVSASTISKYLSGRKKVNGWRTFELKLMNWIFQQNRRNSYLSRSGNNSSLRSTLSNRIVDSSLPVKVSPTSYKITEMNLPLPSLMTISPTTSSQEYLTDRKIEYNRNILTPCQCTMMTSPSRDLDNLAVDQLVPSSNRCNTPLPCPSPSPMPEFLALERDFTHSSCWGPSLEFDSFLCDEEQLFTSKDPLCQEDEQ